MAELIEGKTGTAKDGTRVIVRGGQIVPLDAYEQAGFKNVSPGMYKDGPGRTYREGPKGGFSQVNGPSSGQIDETTKSLASMNNALAGIDRVDEQFRKTKNIGPWGLISNPTQMRVLNQSVKDLQLKLKEQPYNLGVLNGPDLALLEDIVANPKKLENAVFRESVLPRLANLSKIVGDGYRQEASRFGALGGNADIVPLYRSPRSKYTAEEWGKQGRVPPDAMKRGVPNALASNNAAPGKRPPLSSFQKK